MALTHGRKGVPAAVHLAAMLAFSAPVLAGEGKGSPVASPREIARMLHDLAARYGHDAALLDVLLLKNAVRGGARLATEVQIVGHQERKGRRYLYYRVETGMLFDASRDDRRARIDTIWDRVVARSLRQLDRFNIDVDGLTIDLGYAHVAGPESLGPGHDPEGAGVAERFRVHLLRADWEDLIAGRATSEDLFGRVAKEVDGQPYEPRQE